MKLTKGLRGRLSRTAAVGVTLAVAATTTSVLTGSTTAVSAPADDCPTAVPVTELTKDQPVDVLTVTNGTTPESFTGKVIGVLNDGIAPGLDMILVDFKTVAPAPPTIIDEAGIWSGMSGSPVYDAADGRLIGAVAYGLSFGPSTVAGVTPAADMQKLLEGTAGSGALGSPSATPNKVQIPNATAREMVREGNATAVQVDEGLTRLRTPLGISGLSPKRPLGRVARMLGLDNVRLFHASAAPSAAGEDIPIAPGGNLAASMSYGDLSAVAVGTATAVCGTEVLAFGHPFNWTGPTTLSMHGADALLIQPDPTVAGFKVANPGARTGIIDQDRLAALHGVLDQFPDTTRVHSVVTAEGRSRTGNTFISVPDAMPDLAALHMLVNQDTVLDGAGKGSALVKWTVVGERKNGQPFRFSHEDRYANNFDISFEPVFEVLDQLFQLHDNRFEAVKVTNINYESSMTRKVRSFTVKRLQRKQDGVWRSVSPNRRLVVRPGRVLRLRVTMGSFRNEVGSKVRRFQIRVPNAANRTRGALTISGGNSFFGFGFEEEFEDGFGSPSSGSFNDMIKKFANEPRNDVLTAKLSVFKFNGRVVNRQQKSSVGDVVGGGFQLPVVIRRR